MKEREVLMIFKTHLDVGFTDLSRNIMDKYMNTYIPNAIKVGYELKGTSTPFVWTVGSFLIWEALKNDADGSVDRAIRDGILTWHALPFTTHTELMNEELFRLGLSLSGKLDARYGKKTIGAKMTDVPGHTIGMVPLMQQSGITMLHIGVNTATPVPPVPPAFRWKCGESEITVLYQSDYGSAMEFDDFVIYFAHTNDNMGPQSKEQIIEIYNEVQKLYPGCALKAATLDDAARRVAEIKNLPVFEKEIGDTWIHGAGTDPQKISRYRRLLRHISENGVPECDLSDSLLLVPEHTWGMDQKTFFRNETAFTTEELEACAEWRRPIEQSWQEQREYVAAAEKLMGVTPEYPISQPELSGCVPTDTPEEPPFEISWEIFDRSDYDRYLRDYVRLNENTADWAVWDFTRVGLPEYRGGIYTAKAVAAYRRNDETLWRMEFDADAAADYGLPWFFVRVASDSVEIRWFGKKISRLPQACWLKFRGMEEKWQLHKLGQWIDPYDVAGSPLISAVDRGVRNSHVEIRPIDSALVAPYGRRLLQYGCSCDAQDLYFNLYNNIWNTNFPIWYGDDAMFRFVVKNRC